MPNTWRVLIADDEPIIREGIRDALDWKAMHMKVIAEAEDGEEALELALEHDIHVLLVDLNMPIMNGMTLIRHMREKLPQCKIVIITGHDEFTYAQEAIRLNVDDYILKPANPEQLRSVLENVRKSLETTIQQKQYLEMASNQITKNFTILRERFYLEWIEGGMTEGEIIEQLHFLQLPAACPRQLGVIQCPEFYANQLLMKENDRRLLLFAIENIVSELLKPLQNSIFHDHTGLVVVFLWDMTPTEKLFEIERMLKHYLKIAINMHFESVGQEIAAIPHVYRHCKKIIYKDMHISPMVRRAREYISNHFSEADLTLESLAHSLQVSSVYLSKMIKQELGMSFVGLLTNMRIKKAIELLNTTDFSIYEIAERVGYETQHYFSTAFKKAVGVSPKQYRKEAAMPHDMQKEKKRLT